MASSSLIPRLPNAAMVFSPTTPDFAGAVQQELGDLGTGRDGFDAIFAVPAANIDTDAAAVASLDTDVAAAEFAEGDFYRAYHAAVDSELPGLLNDGDALNAAVQTPGQADGTPVIAPPPTPPDAGGGVSTGSGGGDGGASGDGGGDGGGIIIDQGTGEDPGWDPYWWFNFWEM